jgi:hypothetical protein
MQVGVNELLKLITGGAGATGISIAAVPAVDVLTQRQGKSETSATRFLSEKNGVGEPFLLNHPYKIILEGLISYYISKSHPK